MLEAFFQVYLQGLLQGLGFLTVYLFYKKLTK